MVERSLVTTSFEFKGYRITDYRGIVKGITVRSRSVLGNIGAGFQAFFGGNITLYQELCEKAREDAYQLMVRHAEEMGANAVIGMRYEANELMSGITEVLCYGTAVNVSKE